MKAILAAAPALLRRLFLERLLRRLEIPIAQSVHFCGFHYGSGTFNPYENYLHNLVAGMPVEQAREQFIDFLRYYRPRHMGAALGLNLSREYPLWIYPWNFFSRQRFATQSAWFDNPDHCPDILTHFSEAGVLAFRIEEEFVWLERALYSIVSEGYRPERYGYGRVVQLCRSDGTCMYLMLDGNHRISALSALRQQTMRVLLSVGDIVREEDCEKWYGVRQGFYACDDALKMFHVYFEGNHSYPRAQNPARILSLSEVLR